MLSTLAPGAATPSEVARILGTRPERIREALRDGCTVRTANRWRAHVRTSSPVAPVEPYQPDEG